MDANNTALLTCCCLQFLTYEIHKNRTNHVTSLASAANIQVHLRLS